MSIANVATKWVLQKLEKSCGGSVILGIRDVKWIQETNQIEKFRLDDEDLRNIEAILERGERYEGGIWEDQRN